MKLMKVKTVRFRLIVGQCGQPEVYTMWQKPADDRRLQSLIKNNRVMTIKTSSSGTDYGVVGFHSEKGVRYLAFDKSLKLFEGTRVIGIDWKSVRS